MARKIRDTVAEILARWKRPDESVPSYHRQSIERRIRQRVMGRVWKELGKPIFEGILDYLPADSYSDSDPPGEPSETHDCTDGGMTYRKSIDGVVIYLPR